MDLSKELYTTGEVANILRVSPDAIRAWIHEGKISPDDVVVLPSGHRRIKRSAVLKLLDKRGIDINKYVVVYARESSSHQKGSLNKQVQQLIEWANSNGLKVDKVITDIASSMNFKRKGLQELINLAESGNLAKVIIAYKDRLTRFGFDFFEWFFGKHGVEIVVVNSFAEDKPDSRQEIIDDFVAIIHYFTMRIYGSRHYKSKEKQLKELLDVGKEN